MAKDNPIFKPIFSYNDKGKSVVFDGANQVEVNRMNKKMCSAIEISKERYFKLKEAGFSDFDITRCLTTKLAHSTAKKQTEAPRQKLGLYHRNSLIEHTVLESNVHIFTQIRKIFNSDELKKALYDLFNTKDINKSMDLASDMFIKGEISDVQFEGVKSKYEELNQPISKVEEVKQVKIHEQWL